MKPCIDVKALIEYPSDLIEKIYNTCSDGKKMPILAYLVYSCNASNQELAFRLVRGPWLAQRKLRTSIKFPAGPELKGTKGKALVAVLPTGPIRGRHGRGCCV